MKPKIVLGFFFALLVANTLFAKIGETEAQTDHRYGKPRGQWDDYLGYKKLYRWHGFEVMVTFLDGVSQREMFVKIEGPANAKVQKYLVKISGSGQNGVVFDDKSGVFTTKAFEEKFIAARTAAWAKADEKK